MTSSGRISLILLVFFLLPTVIFSLDCYEGIKNATHFPPQIWKCDDYQTRCTKTFWFPRNQPMAVSYLCDRGVEKDGWYTVSDEASWRVYKYVCSTDLCNAPSISITDPGGPPLPPSLASSKKPKCTTKKGNANQQTTPTPSGTKGNGNDPSNPLGGFGALKAAGHQSTWMCLMGMMMSWLLLIN